MDFRLKVFISAAVNLNFTKTAKELFISQPAVSKHIQELENIYNVQLFERKGGRLVLTPAGGVLLSNALKIRDNYHLLEHEMSMFGSTICGTLNLIASTTISQYLLPNIIADFIKCFPEIKINLTTANTLDTEKAVEQSKDDLGFVEGNSHRQGLRYSEFMRDELVLTTSAQTVCEDEINLEMLKSIPLLLRETGSGTLDIIESELLSHHIKLTDLNILTQFDNTESIKLFLKKSPGTYAIVSIISIVNDLKDGKLKVIDIADMTFSRKFSYITKQGVNDSLVDKFVLFLKSIDN